MDPRLSPPRRRPRDRPPQRGATLVEVVVALAVLILATTAYLLAGSGLVDHPGVAESAARAVAAEARQAIAGAAARGGDAVLRADADTASGARGRFRAAAGPPGFPADFPADPGGPGRLVDGAQWGGARVAADPLGAPLAGWRPVGTVRCAPAASAADRALGTGMRCGLGGAPHLTYLVGHKDDPDAAAAVVLLADGRVRVFRWQSGTGRWLEGAP